MLIQNWLHHLSDRFTRTQTRSRRVLTSRGRCQQELPNSLPRSAEVLEDRTLLTTRLFIDFGDRFPGGELETTVGDLDSYQLDNNPDINGPSLSDDTRNAYSDETSVVIESFQSIYGDSAATRARRDVIENLVTRFFQPLDVVVTELTSAWQVVSGQQVRAAASVDDISRTLGANENEPENNDAYIIVGRFVIDGTDNPTEFANNAYGGLAPVDVSNTRDHTAFVMLRDLNEGLYSEEFLATQVAHEASHTFGLRHSFGDVQSVPSPGSMIDTGLLRSDIQSYLGYTTFGGLNFFTRYPLPRGGRDANGTANSDNDLAAAIVPPAPTNRPTQFDQLANTASIGPNADYEFVSGTGQNDVIAIRKADADSALVLVQAFDDPARTSAITVPVIGGTIYSYTIPLNKPIIVSGGARDDHFIIDGNLGVEVIVQGMHGADELTVLGHDAAKASYTPSSFSAPLDGNDDLRGRLTVGATTFDFVEFDVNSKVTIKDVSTIRVNGSDGRDRIRTQRVDGVQTVHGSIDGTASSAPHPIVPLHLTNVPQLELDTRKDVDTILIEQVVDGVTLDVNAGSGADDFQVGTGLFYSEIQGVVRILESDALDSLLIRNRGALAADAEYQFDRINGCNVFQHANSQASIMFGNVASLTVHGSDRDDDVFDVRRLSLPTGATATIFGHGGADTFFVGRGNYVGNIAAQFHLDGGAGHDRLFIDDAAQPGKLFDPLNYQLNTASQDQYAGQFRKYEFLNPLAGTAYSETLTFTGMQRFTLTADNRSSRVDLNSTTVGTKYVLEGQGGADQFSVDASHLRSNVLISGGDPAEEPGDSLRLHGDDHLTAEYRPAITSASAGSIEIASPQALAKLPFVIEFSTLESAAASHFSDLTVITPGSHDLLTASAESDGWTTIRGASGGFDSRGNLPALFPILNLAFRDVQRLNLDTASHDDTSFETTRSGESVTYLPYPIDSIFLEPGALEARGLEKVAIRTGAGTNVVTDSTLEGTAGDPARLYVDGSGGFTQVLVNGAIARGDFVHVDNSHVDFVARDSSDLVRHQLGFDFVELLVTPRRPEELNAIVHDGQLTFENDTLIGDYTTMRLPAGSTGSLRAIPIGQSQLNLGTFDYTGFSISADLPPMPESSNSPPGASTQAVIAIIAELVQDASARFPVSGFGGGDRLTFTSAQLNGTTLPTDFEVDTQPSSGFDAIELLVDFGERVGQLGFALDSTAEDAGPSLAFLGAPDIDNRATLNRLASGTSGSLHSNRLFLSEIETVEINGSTDAESVSVAAMPGGGLQVSLESSNDAGASIELLTDRHTNDLAVQGALGDDRITVLYPEPDFRAYRIDATSVETIEWTPQPTSASLQAAPDVDQLISPSAGHTQTHNVTLTHDETVSSSILNDFSSIELLVTKDSKSDTFDRDLFLSQTYSGSRGQVVFKDVKFHGDVVWKARHQEAADNLTTFQEKNVVYEQASRKTIHGSDTGTDNVLWTQAGVTARQGSDFEVAAQNGEATLVFTKADSKVGPGLTDTISIEAGDGTHSVLLHNENGTTPEKQLRKLVEQNPESVGAIELLTAQADQELLQLMSQSAEEAGSKKVLNFSGHKSNLTLNVHNAEPDPIEADVDNPEGITDISTLGNVDVDVPALAGIGIDPTYPFTTFPVTNTHDSGPGSLRAAIEAANAWTSDERPVISFAIPGSDPGFLDADQDLMNGDADPDAFVISLLSALPSLMRDGTVVNGQSQHATTGDSNPFGPEVVLNGQHAGSTADGLHLAASDSYVHGLNVHSFNRQGVSIFGDHNLLSHSFVGTDATGTEARPNAGNGVLVVSATGNVIERNTVSGNRGSGILLVEGSGHTIQGNSIGIAADGLADLGNFDGVHLQETTDVRIGGTTLGAANVISGNARYGVGVGASQNTTIQGNLIGTDEAGQVAVRNGLAGVELIGGTFNTVIGGSDARAGNLISGNTYGIRIAGAGATEHVRIEGNQIGTDAAGGGAVPNRIGIQVLASGGHVVGNVTIGGAAAGAGNVISGNNLEGVHVIGAGAQNIRIQGNLIGTDLTGTQVVPNQRGIYLEDTTDGLVGGSDEGAGNVISGNGRNVTLRSGGRHLVQGNRIGTNRQGSAAPGGGTTTSNPDGIGIFEGSTGNVISDNLLSGNRGNAVWINESPGNTVQGNIIGLDATGTRVLRAPGSTLSNLRGIYLVNSPSNQIGGATPGTRNVIANNLVGIALSGADSQQNRIQGNYVGTDVSGTLPHGNFATGIGLTVGADANVIGTDGDGVDDASEGNLVSAQVGHYHVGINVDSQFNTIAGNRVGTDATGTQPLENFVGIRLRNGHNTVGTDGDGISDALEGNLADSIELIGSSFPEGASYNVVAGNRIGTDTTGLERLTRGGLLVRNGANFNRIGTNGDGVSDALERNVIVANLPAANGMILWDSQGNQVAGNFIGVGADGTTPLGSSAAGVEIAQNATGNTIGGPTPAMRNVIGNNSVGIELRSESSMVIGNLIADNVNAGVRVLGDSATRNTIRRNAMLANGALGIDLGPAGVTINDEGDANADPPIAPDLDTGANDLQNFPELKSAIANPSGIRVAGQLRSTPLQTFILDFYAVVDVDPSGFGEGARWLASLETTTDERGVAGFSLEIADAVSGEYITATATNSSGSTSEFSAAQLVRARRNHETGQPPRATTLAENSLLAWDGSSEPTVEDATGITPVQTANPIPADSNSHTESTADSSGEPLSESSSVETHPDGETVEAFFAEFADVLSDDLLIAS